GEELIYLVPAPDTTGELSWAELITALPSSPNLRRPEFAAHLRDAERTGTRPARIGTPEARELIANHPGRFIYVVPHTTVRLHTPGDLWISPLHGILDPAPPIRHTVPAHGDSIATGGEVGLFAEDGEIFYYMISDGFRDDERDLFTETGYHMHM